MGKVATKTKRPAQTQARRKVQPEQVIVKLAQEGKLAAIGKKAMEDTFRLGLPVTRVEGINVVKIFPDGKREIIKVLEGPSKAS